MSMEKFLSLVFDPEDHTCYTQSPNGTEVGWQPLESDLFYCVNSLCPDKDLNPTQAWHRADRPRRADANVIKLRNFLIEIDSMPIEEQRPYMDSLKVPYSAVVFSGSKSLHFVLSLEQPVPTYEQYMDISRRLHRLITHADHSSKNPSRLSRLPFRVRPDTGKMQELIYLGSRISLQALEAVLPKAAPKRTYTKDEKTAMVSPLLLAAAFSPDETMAKLNIGGRNALFYWMHCRFQELDLSPDKRERFVDQAFNNLQDKSGFSYEEALFAARIKGV